MLPEIFIEEQVPDGSSTKLWRFSIVISILISVLFAIFAILQLLLNIKLGHYPFAKLNLLVSGLVLWFIVYLVLKIKMITRISDKYLEISFIGIPFIKKIPLSSIRSLEKINFSAYEAYGGYGIRYSANMGWAYLMNDSSGILLYLDNKAKPILIGSQRADELFGALQKRMGSS